MILEIIQLTVPIKISAGGIQVCVTPVEPLAGPMHISIDDVNEKE